MNVKNHAELGVLGVVQRESQVGIGQHHTKIDKIGIGPGGKYDNRPEKKNSKNCTKKKFFFQRLD